MKSINNTQTRPTKDHLAISQLMNTLKQINLNSSWKGSSIQMNKMKTGLIKQDQRHTNNMTEQDVDKLFVRSKEKLKMKTEISHGERIDTEITQKNEKDFTQTKFLHIEDQYDRFLTGMPSQSNNKENIMNYRDQSDLTLKFKKNYVVGKVIGEGAYALVRVAIFKPQNKKIAIKAYEKLKIKQPARKRTVRRQIKILQNLNHQNIVKIYDVVQTNNHLNIIMQYLPGISLGSSLKQQSNQKFTEINCKFIIKQLANALKYLHSKNIAHRDIKLENVILDEKFTPKLIDFGFSTCIEKNTKIKIFCGTPSYMAPEIVQKKEYRGQAADIWALGVMMFVMLLGYFPYKGSTDDQLYRKINAAQYPKQDIHNYKKAQHLITKMFLVDPQQRITASEILNHPWISDSKENVNFQKKIKNQTLQLNYLLSKSKQRNPSNNDNHSRKKRPYQMIYNKPLNRTIKDLSGTLNSNLNRTSKLQKTTVNPLKEYKELKLISNNKTKVDHKMRILDVLKIQLRKVSEEKPKCKSHRI